MADKRCVSCREPITGELGPCHMCIASMDPLARNPHLDFCSACAHDVRRRDLVFHTKLNILLSEVGEMRWGKDYRPKTFPDSTCPAPERPVK